MTFRFANEADTALILKFVRGLAAYEHLEDQVVADEETLRRELFERKGAEVIFVLENGKEVGFALFFHNFSTFLGRAGIYLEDLFVLPEHRGKGYGTKGLALTLKIAREIVPEDEIYLRVLKTNVPSYKVICNNGGYIAGEDDTHYLLRIRKHESH